MWPLRIACGRNRGGLLDRAGVEQADLRAVPERQVPDAAHGEAEAGIEVRAVLVPERDDPRLQAIRVLDHAMHDGLDSTHCRGKVGREDERPELTCHCAPARSRATFPGTGPATAPRCCRARPARARPRGCGCARDRRNPPRRRAHDRAARPPADASGPRSQSPSGTWKARFGRACCDGASSSRSTARRTALPPFRR